MSETHPGDLPADLTEIRDIARPLIIDARLGRDDLITRIADATGIDVAHPHDKLIHTETAALLRYTDDTEQRSLTAIARDRPKYDIITALADHYGFPARSDQDTLIKSQLTHILLAEVTDRPPEPFSLPADPDIDLYGQDGQPNSYHADHPHAKIGGD